MVKFLFNQVRNDHLDELIGNKKRWRNKRWKDEVKDDKKGKKEEWRRMKKNEDEGQNSHVILWLLLSNKSVEW